MRPGFDKPIVFLDLEATGLSLQDDRIVEIAMIKQTPDGQEETFTSLINPGISIPEEVVDIHHITNEMVRAAPTLVVIGAKIVDFIGNADLGGYGLTRYDIPLLKNDLKRAGFDWSFEGRRIFDALTIFRKLEKRDLTAAYKFFCGKEIGDAHRAEADTRATCEVFWAQLERYPQIPQDAAALAAYCAEKDPRYVDELGRLVWRNGEAAFNFGKHRSMTLRDISNREPSYLEWLIAGTQTSKELAKIYSEALRGQFPTKKK
jgi:DNA polymerase-3 subunit epsilon